MRVLVTGGCGFIGQHLVQSLVGLGHDVWVLDAHTYAATGWKAITDLLGHGTPHEPCVFRGDVTRPGDVRGAMNYARPDVVYHLAAESHVDASLRNPSRALEVNAIGTQMVAAACAKARVPLLYCSTDEVYGDMADYGAEAYPDGAVENRTPMRPSSPYSAGKAAGEMAVGAICRSFGLAATITRGSNAWGPGQYPEKLVPIACRLLQRRHAVSVHGDGEQVRQWIAVEDFVDGLQRAAVELVTEDRRGEPPRIYNLAGPTRLSVRELLERLCLFTGQSRDLLVQVADRPGQDRSYHVSGGLAYERLGFLPSKRIEDDESIQAMLTAYPADGDLKISDFG